MASREVASNNRTVERWTNEGTAGYYSGVRAAYSALLADARPLLTSRAVTG